MNKKGFVLNLLWFIIIVVILFLLIVGSKTSSLAIQSPASFMFTQEIKDKELTENLRIGDLILASEEPVFVCDKTNDVSAPEPRSNCWRETFSFNGRETQVNDGETIRLNDYITAVYHVAAKWDAADGRIENWRNTFEIKFTNKDFLTASFDDAISMAELGQPKNIRLNIKNDLTNINGGVYLQAESKKLFGQKTEIKEINLIKGTKTYEFPLDTEKLGAIKIKATPFIKIKSNDVEYTLVDDKTEEKTYFVVPKIANAQPLKEEPSSISGGVLDGIFNFIKRLFSGDVFV